MSKLSEYFGVKVKSGEYIFKQNDSADMVYMIHKGRIQIRMHKDGVVKNLQILKEGEFVGEMAIINSKGRSADAIALEDSELIRMDKESFNSTVRDNHQFALSVIESLSDRLRNADETISELAENDRLNKFLFLIISEMFSSGKTDQTGSWKLIKTKEVVLSIEEKYPHFKDVLFIVIPKLVDKGILNLKKDKNNSEWLAFNIKK